jgi:folate-binding protein YgfZ
MNRARAILRLSGPDRIHFLQGILTQDVTKLADQRLQFAAMLSPQGKILHDMFLVDAGDAILIDTDAASKDVLMKRLAMYKLRAQVTIDDSMIGLSDNPWSCTIADPRHPELPHRHYTDSKQHGLLVTTHPPLATCHPPLTLGIPELGVDFEPDSITAMDAGYDLLHAISFTKGCYVGQEVTARMYYKNIARRGFFILENEAGIPQKLALLKFDAVATIHNPQSTIERFSVTVENQTYTARLPSWMQPKLDLFRRGDEKQ